jgi:cytochrome oxidase assembly protein ShyY1
MIVDFGSVLAGAVFAQTGTPMPTPSMTVDPNSVTPGPAGFAVIVFIVIVVALLIWDMNRRVRRVRYRAEVREELDAEEAAAREKDEQNPPS